MASVQSNHLVFQLPQAAQESGVFLRMQMEREQATETQTQPVPFLEKKQSVVFVHCLVCQSLLLGQAKRGSLIQNLCYLTRTISPLNMRFMGIVIPWAVAVAVVSDMPLVTVFTKIPSL